MTQNIVDHKVTGGYDFPRGGPFPGGGLMAVFWNSEAAGRIDKIEFFLDLPAPVSCPVTFHPDTQSYSFDSVTLGVNTVTAEFQFQDASPGQEGKYVMRGRIRFNQSPWRPLAQQQRNIVFVSERGGRLQLNPNPIVFARPSAGGPDRIVFQAVFQAADGEPYDIDFDTPCPFRNCSSIALRTHGTTEARVLLPDPEVGDYYYTAKIRSPKREDPVRGAMNVE